MVEQPFYQLDTGIADRKGGGCSIPPAIAIVPSVGRITMFRKGQEVKIKS